MIPLFKVRAPERIGFDLEEVFQSGVITEGPAVKEFEQELRREMFDVGVPLCSVNSCTSALTLALRVLDIGEYTTVVTTPMTCSATNLPIITSGATPVFADIDPRTGLIDVEDVQRMVTDNDATAVMCVDWGGMPCDLDDLRSIGVPIIEDAAHSFGARYKRIPIGMQADFTCFSFQAIKHLTTGDGGLLVGCPGRESDIERARLLRWFGIDRDGPRGGDSRIDVDITEAGYKFHMNDIAATIGLAGLRDIHDVIGAHRSNAHYYMEHLDSKFEVPPQKADREGSYWIFTLLLPKHGIQEQFRKFMAERGVQVSRVHRRNDTYSVFKHFATRQLPGVDEFYGRVMCLPCHYALTVEDLKIVVDAANAFVTKEL